MQTTIQAQVREISNWLRHQAEQSKSSGAVIEVTGDVDSAVAAGLAKEAFGDSLLGLILHSKDASHDLELATLISNHLGIRCETLDLTASTQQLFSILPKAPNEVNRMTRCWLRLTALRHTAATLNSLLIGAGNRSDWEIGRLTHPGDDQVDLLPTAHLLRTEVVAIARHFGFASGLFLETASVLDGTSLDRDMTCPVVTYSDLDAYLSGNFMAVPKELQRRIRALQQHATQKRRRALRFTHLGSPHENDSDAVDDQETYDRSIEALTLISKAITSDQYLEDILGLVVMVTAEVMKSSVCSLWLLDDKGGVLRLRATQSIDREYLKDRVLRVGEGVVGKVAAENRAYVVHNVLEDPIFKEKELARRMGLVSMLSIPMRVKDRVIGVVNCYTSHPHVFSDLQMNVLTTVANQAAVAIENTELMVQTKVISEELERRKIIERAKDLLMKRLDLSGEEAYRWLQKRSMNTRKSMREVSEAVLLTMET
jgi:NAD+ synthetase